MEDENSPQSEPDFPFTDREMGVLAAITLVAFAVVFIVVYLLPHTPK